MATICRRAPPCSSSRTCSTGTRATFPIPSAFSRSASSRRTVADAIRTLTCRLAPGRAIASVLLSSDALEAFSYAKDARTLISQSLDSGQKFALMEEKVILASILRRFNVESIDQLQDVAILTELILRPRDGIRMRLTRKC